jgi:signal transduction histidine kinase
MNAMNETGSASFRKNVRFVLDRPLSFPNGSHWRERKKSMAPDHTLSATQGQLVAFISHKRSTQSQANTERVTLQLEAQQAERKRIAQELHDTLLQGFTCIALKLDALSHGLPPALSKTKQQLQGILEETDEHLAEARRAIWKLRSATPGDGESFSTALTRACERTLAGTGIRLSFFVRGCERKIQSAFEDNLLRICEEAVTNAIKHARATQVDVTLEFNSEAVQLRVRDNGCGFNPGISDAAKSGHFGLQGITERIEALSGMLSIDSASGSGTGLWVAIPTDGRARGSRSESPNSARGLDCLWSEASYTSR